MVQLDERFLVVHYGVKAPLEVPSPLVTQPSPVVAVELVSCVDDGVAQLVPQPKDQAPPVTPDCPECDAEVAIDVVGEYAPFVERDYTPHVQSPHCEFVEGVAWIDADGCWAAKVSMEDAPVYTAPQWDRRRGSGGEGEGGSVAGWSDASEALTVLHMVTMWHVARP